MNQNKFIYAFLILFIAVSHHTANAAYLGLEILPKMSSSADKGTTLLSRYPFGTDISVNNRFRYGLEMGLRTRPLFPFENTLPRYRGMDLFWVGRYDLNENLNFYTKLGVCSESVTKIDNTGVSTISRRIYPEIKVGSEVNITPRLSLNISLNKSFEKVSVLSVNNSLGVQKTYGSLGLSWRF